MADPNCPHCAGTGWKIVERSGMSGAARCDCASFGRNDGLVEAARIPSNYERATLDSFVLPPDNPTARTGLGIALRQAMGFARDFPAVTPPGLLLVGEPGTGKTHLAVGVVKALLEKGHECVFFDYKNLLDRIRSSYDSSSGTTDRAVYGTALDADVLLLDDLGAHRVTEWVEDTVTSIITYRCNNRKPLIATTNLPDPDVTGKMVEYTGAGGVAVFKKTLADAIGTRARSRLFEMCKVIRMPATEDYRVKHAR
ncbi:MAG TPA: ATP-binding protein [Bryobacteraceae bacterium]|nr:ATP-binding protein [Bryobacteraceae bacterium]